MWFRFIACYRGRLRVGPYNITSVVSTMKLCIILDYIIIVVANCSIRRSRRDTRHVTRDMFIYYYFLQRSPIVIILLSLWVVVGGVYVYKHSETSRRIDFSVDSFLRDTGNKLIINNESIKNVFVILCHGH